jgi:hypothetical protein
MWDLTVPGDNDHDFYVLTTTGTTAILAHNCGPGLLSASHEALGDPSARGGVYALVSESGVVQRTGSTSNLATRLAKHAKTYPGLVGVALFRTDDYATYRGLEEMTENWFSPILARQSAIDLGNPRRGEYIQAASNFLSAWLGRLGT